MNKKLLQASILGFESVLYLPKIGEARGIIQDIVDKYEETPAASWQYDQATGEEQQTIFGEVKQESGRGEFVGDLFNYTEE